MGLGRGSGSLGCGSSMARMLLIIFNVIFFILGAASLGVGIWVLVDTKSFMNLFKLGPTNSTADVKKAAENYVNSPSLLRASAYTMIGIGAFNFIVGFCGCCGAVKLSKCLLYIYSFLVGFVLLVEVTGAVLGIVFKKDIENELQKQLKFSLNTYYMGVEAGYASKADAQGVITLAWDYAHVLLGCCGVNGTADFNSNTLWWKKYRKYSVNGVDYTNDRVHIPTTCCQMKSDTFAAKGDWPSVQNNMKNPNCPIAPGGPTDYNTEGCFKALEKKVLSYSTILIGVAAGIAAFELLGIIFACCLISAINNDEKTKY